MRAPSALGVLLLCFLVTGCSLTLPPLPQSPPVGSTALPIVKQIELVPSSIAEGEIELLLNLTPPDDSIYAVYRVIYIDDAPTGLRVGNSFPDPTDHFTAIVPSKFTQQFPSVQSRVDFGLLTPGIHNLSVLAYRLDEVRKEWDYSRFYVFTQTFEIEPALCEAGSSRCDGNTRIYCQDGMEQEEHCSFLCVGNTCVPWLVCDDGVCDSDVDCGCLAFGDCDKDICLDGNDTDTDTDMEYGGYPDDCGTSTTMDELLAAEDVDVEQDRALVCMGHHILAGCDPAFTLIETNVSGLLRYQVADKDGFCVVHVQYGSEDQILSEEQKPYAGRFVDCEVELSELFGLDRSTYNDQPGVVGSSLYIYTALLILSEDTGCTGTLFDGELA
ncbi:MAG: hypothetical protein ABIC95_07345 [archaeon]